MNVMVICGFIMALYIFVQKAELDQFFGKISSDINPDVDALKSPLLGGFIGQSTVVAPFVAMCIPLTVYFKRYIWAIAMATAVLLTQSKMGIGAMSVGMAVYFILSRRRWYKVIGIGIICLLLSAGSVWLKNNVTNRPNKNFNR